MTAALLVFAIAVFVFTAVCVIQFIRVAIDAAEERAAVDRWWKERKEYQDRIDNDPGSGAA